MREGASPNRSSLLARRSLSARVSQPPTRQPWSLLIDFFPQVVEVGSFPGTLAYTFPADGVHTEVFSGGVHPAHGSPPCDVGRVVYARS